MEGFKPETRIPHCLFRAKYFGDLATIPDLECSVAILGAKVPRKFAIDFIPSREMTDSVQQPSTSKRRFLSTVGGGYDLSK